MRLIDFDKIPFLAIPIAPVVKGESVHYEQGALKEWFDGTAEVEAVPLEKIKQARLEMEDYNVRKEFDGCSDLFKLGVTRGLDLAVEILDKLIAETEEKDGVNK